METISNNSKTRYYISGCLTSIFCKVVNFDPQYIKKFIEESNSSLPVAEMKILDFRCCDSNLCNIKIKESLDSTKEKILNSNNNAPNITTILIKRVSSKSSSISYKNKHFILFILIMSSYLDIYFY